MVSLEKLGVTVLRAQQSEQFYFAMDAREKAACKAQHQAAFAKIRTATSYDLVVLDELLDAVALGLIDEEAVCRYLAEKSGGSEVVLTGREAGPAIAACADYHSHIHCVKHPYKSGVPARRGIEY